MPDPYANGSEDYAELEALKRAVEGSWCSDELLGRTLRNAWPSLELTLRVALAARRPDREGRVSVPKTALEWLFGEGVDDKGKSFGEVMDEVPLFRGRTPPYWWRSHFRNLCGLGFRYDKQARTIVPVSSTDEQQVGSATK